MKQESIFYFEDDAVQYHENVPENLNIDRRIIGNTALKTAYELIALRICNLLEIYKTDYSELIKVFGIVSEAIAKSPEFVVYDEDDNNLSFDMDNVFYQGFNSNLYEITNQSPFNGGNSNLLPFLFRSCVDKRCEDLPSVLDLASTNSKKKNQNGDDRLTDDALKEIQLITTTLIGEAVDLAKFKLEQEASANKQPSPKLSPRSSLNVQNKETGQDISNVPS